MDFCKTIYKATVCVARRCAWTGIQCSVPGSVSVPAAAGGAGGGGLIDEAIGEFIGKILYWLLSCLFFIGLFFIKKCVKTRVPGSNEPAAVPLPLRAAAQRQLQQNNPFSV